MSSIYGVIKDKRYVLWVELNVLETLVANTFILEGNNHKCTLCVIIFHFRKKVVYKPLNSFFLLLLLIRGPRQGTSKLEPTVKEC